MDIGLIDVDSHNYPNFALMRYSGYHKAMGDNVEMAESGLFGKRYDLIMASKTFTFSKDFNRGDYNAAEFSPRIGFKCKEHFNNIIV